MNIQLSEHFTYKKLLRFILPSIIMMVFTSIYSVVDGIFVSNFVGKSAFASVNLIRSKCTCSEILCGRKNKRNVGDGTYGYCTCSGKRSGDGGDRSGLCQRRAGNYGDTG